MDVLLLTGEWLVGGCLLIVLLVLSHVFIRRRLIARGKPLTVCALREAGDDTWRFGLARYGTTAVEWYPLEGLSVRPAREWDRSLLDIETSRPLENGERPEALIPGAMRVDCSYHQARFEIALAEAQYTALRSWVEASPPGRNLNVV